MPCVTKVTDTTCTVDVEWIFPKELRWVRFPERSAFPPSEMRDAYVRLGEEINEHTVSEGECKRGTPGE